MTHILEIEVEIVENRDISDLTYKKMSSEAYNDFKTNKIDSLPGWEIIDQKT